MFMPCSFLSDFSARDVFSMPFSFSVPLRIHPVDCSNCSDLPLSNFLGFRDVSYIWALDCIVTDSCLTHGISPTWSECLPFTSCPHVNHFISSRTTWVCLGLVLRFPTSLSVLDWVDGVSSNRLLFCQLLHSVHPSFYGTYLHKWLYFFWFTEMGFSSVCYVVFMVWNSQCLEITNWAGAAAQ